MSHHRRTTCSLSPTRQEAAQVTHTCQCPPDVPKLSLQDGGKLQLSPAGVKKPARRRSVVRKPEEYEVNVNDAIFSSSQLIRGGITAGKEMPSFRSQTS